MANIKICKNWYHIDFALALTFSKIWTFKICHLQNLGQGYKEQHLPWCHSIGNTRSINRAHFYVRSHCLRDFKDHIFYLDNLGQGQGVQQL